MGFIRHGEKDEGESTKKVDDRFSSSFKGITHDCMINLHYNMYATERNLKGFAPWIKNAALKSYIFCNI